MTHTLLQERRVDVNGVGTVVLEGGDPAQRSAVVFVHGNPGSGQDWVDLAQDAARFSRVVVFDMPGFGRADKPADFPSSVEGGAAFLGALLDQLGVERAHLVLHDFGGPWGLAWALAEPHKAASIALINTGILPGYRWHAMARIWRMPLVGELSQALTTRRGFHFALRRSSPRGLPAAFIERMFNDYDHGTRRAVLKLYRATDDPAERSRQIVEPLKALSLPAVVIWGARDPFIPMQYAALQRLAFPQAQIHTLQDSGHWPFVDNPAGTREALMPFLLNQLGLLHSRAA
jgi:pimeloyl-ACP methyl ester carboxylesterase